MEKAFEKQSVEAIKATILRQEEIFRQQVRELHRLYSVQTMLMDELKSEIQRKSQYSTTPRKIPQSTTGLGYSFHIQKHLWEQRGSCSSSDTMTKKNEKAGGGFELDLQRQAYHQVDNTTGISITAVEAAAEPSSSSSKIIIGPSSTSGARHTGFEEDLCGLDLTLNIGGGGDKTLKELQPYQCIGFGCSEQGKLDHECRGQQTFLPSSMSSSSTTTLDQGEEERPHWSFQALNRKRM